MLLLAKLIIGAIMISLTVVIHAVMCDFTIHFIEKNIPTFKRIFKNIWKIGVLICAVSIVGAALMIDIWLWTALFYWLEPNILTDLDTALYFTSITFTTVGFGDIVLSPEWRLLSSCTAINGMILFGWSAAFIFEIMTALYKPKDRNWINHDHHTPPTKHH